LFWSIENHPDIAEINASFELNKRKLAFIQMLVASVTRQRNK
jgi:hypothetical protein